MADIFMTDNAKEQAGIRDVKPSGVKTSFKKQSMFRRALDAFFANDRGSIKDHIVLDVIVPAMQTTAVDIVSDTINMLLFGEKRKRSKDTRTPYGSFWASSINEDYKRASAATVGPQRRSSLARYAEVYWEDKRYADKVLDDMINIRDCFPAVTVANFYELISDPDHPENNIPIESIHYKWGWKSLADVKVVNLGGGKWGLSLPRPVHLE